jgi:outer membrane protein assembly factor BamA
VRLLVVAVVAGCAHAPVPRCDLPLATGGDVALSGRSTLAGPIASVELAGAPATLFRAVIDTHPGQQLADAPLRDDLRRLWALGALADARIDARETAAGIAVVFDVMPARRIAAIHGADAPELRRLRYLKGAEYEPRRVKRVADEIETAYRRDGYLDARVAVTRRRSPELELCVAVDRGARQTIGTLTFPGAHAVSEATLLAALHGKGVNHPGGTFDPGALADDKAWLLNEYFERGMVNASVGDPRVTRHGNTLAIAVPITEGPVFHVGTLSGLAVPSTLVAGDVVVRSQIASAVDELGTRLDADVTPISSVDLEHRRVNFSFQLQWRHPWSALRFLRSR